MQISVQIGLNWNWPTGTELGNNWLNWQKLEREGVINQIVKNRSTLFCMIYYSIWPSQGTLCLSVCTPDPQKVIRIINNVNSKPTMSWFLFDFVNLCFNLFYFVYLKQLCTENLVKTAKEIITEDARAG